MNEIWRPVVGWEGLYEVSDLGRVRSFGRVAKCGHGGTRFLKGRLLKAFSGTSGHLRVDLSLDGKRTPSAIHRLVLEAFVGPCPEGQEVLHWDDDPTNNTLGNLRYGTRSENLLDKVRNGRHSMANKTHCPQRHAYTSENTYMYKGRRNCRACARARQQVATLRLQREVS